MSKRSKKSSDRFVRGVRRVAGSGLKPGFLPQWDVNYQVDHKRETKRIEAENFEQALAKKVALKSDLRARLNGSKEGKPVYYLTEVVQQLMKKIEIQVKLGAIDRKAISEVSTRCQRFFLDYPKHLGVEWKTTADFTDTDFKNYGDYYGIVLGRARGRSSEMRKLKRIFSLMKEEKWITRDQLLDLRDVKCPPKNYTPLISNPNEDFEKVLGRLYENDRRSYDYFYFSRRTGRRPTIVRSLLRQDVRLDDEVIYVPKEKHKEESWIPINDVELKKVIIRAMDLSRKLNSPHLFVNKDGRQFSKSNPLRVFKAAAKACGIANWESWTPYQLKKKFLTSGFNANLSSQKMEIVAGLKDLDSVKRHYYRPDASVSAEVFKVTK